ncbi:MAG: alkaline phosphatase D family protein [Myxococcales bacterium]|nr:alkaline phosphatase D family protein [Myxococcales bacterium]
MKFSRRTMLAALGAAACETSVPPDGVTPREFPLGVASGDANDEGAVVWTSYRGGSTVQLELALEDGTNSLTLPVTPDADGFVHVELRGLSAGRWYRYEFVEPTAGGEGARSGPGRFRTAFAADTLAPLRIGAASCINPHYPLLTLRRAAERTDLDAFLLGGDTLYADGARTISGFRDKWYEALGREPHRLLRASTSLIATWDDHEVVDNFPGPDSDGIVDVARDRFFEFLPVRRQVPPERLWRSVRWGRTAEFFVLDARSERNRAAGEYLSKEQFEWLKTGLSTCPARFKVILNSVPISEFPGPLFGLQREDRWEGFPAQRTELLKYIEDEKIPGVLWVSGDFHLATAGRVSRTGPGSTAIEALVGPAGQRPNTSPTYPGKPQFDFASGRNNFTIIDLDPGTGTARLQFVDGDGRVFGDLSYAL